LIVAVWVAPFGVSVITRLPVATPGLSVNVADVFDVTLTFEIESPKRPGVLNSVAAFSWSHTDPALPVAVIVVGTE
jgi:hypothetical protein